MHASSMTSESRWLAALTLSLASLAANAQDITVSAAASLSNAFKDIAAQFEAANPDVSVRLNIAASGVLLQQIEQGAPVDIFASADQTTMDRAAKQSLIDTASRKDFVSNSLVLVQPTDRAYTVGTLDDLKGDKVRRIAIGKPGTVPAGRYTEQALTAANLWVTLQPRIIYADNVRQVLDYVARGEVDAGFVYKTDAQLKSRDVDILLTPGNHDPLTYPIAIVSQSKAKAMAQKFIDYLATAPARDILDGYGFGAP